MTIAITQYILGIKPEYNGLRVNPCIPKDWSSFEVSRKFRGATYKITIKNPNNVSKGVAKILVDGNELIGSILPIYNDGKTHKVEVLMG